jgi:hypothetical protein
MENVKQNYLEEKFSVRTEQIDFDKFVSTSTHYGWANGWSDQLIKRFGATKITRDKDNRLCFHFLNGYTVEEAKVIRKALRKICREAQVPALSVRKGRGTAGGWITISVMGRSRQFNFVENTVLEKFDLTPGSNAEFISPNQTNHYAIKALKLLGETEPTIH